VSGIIIRVPNNNVKFELVACFTAFSLINPSIHRQFTEGNIGTKIIINKGRLVNTQSPIPIHFLAFMINPNQSLSNELGSYESRSRDSACGGCDQRVRRPRTSAATGGRYGRERRVLRSAATGGRQGRKQAWA
jgi:hypothetical protein